MSPKNIGSMSRDEIQEELDSLKKKKLWQRSDEENARLTALAHKLEDMDGKIQYGDTGEDDFSEAAAAAQDVEDGPLEEYIEDEKPIKKPGKKAAKKPAKRPAK